MNHFVIDSEGKTVTTTRTQQTWDHDGNIELEIELNTRDLEAATQWANSYAAARYDVMFREARVVAPTSNILCLFTKKGT